MNETDMARLLAEGQRLAIEREQIISDREEHERNSEWRREER